MITTILFDLDDTLLDFKKSERMALTWSLEEMGIEAKEEILDRYHELNDQMWKKLERKEITRKELKRVRYEILFDEFKLKEDPMTCCKLYEKNLSKTHYFIEGSKEVIETLSTMYDLYVISNGTGFIQRGRMKDTFIERCFKGYYISEEIGYNKPDARFFHYVLEDLQINKDECIVVGDSLTSDIAGATSVSIKTIWYNPSNKVSNTSDFEVQSLTQIDSILKSID